VLAWYDNEWGYSTRLLELCEYVASATSKSKATDRAAAIWVPVQETH